MYNPARAVTDGQGRTISSGADYFGTKTVDLTSKAKPVWDVTVSNWTSLTLSQIMSSTDRKVHKYHALAFHLRNKHPAHTLVSLGLNTGLTKVIRVENMEWRMRGSDIYNRRIPREDNS